MKTYPYAVMDTNHGHILSSPWSYHKTPETTIAAAAAENKGDYNQHYMAIVWDSPRDSRIFADEGEAINA